MPWSTKHKFASPANNEGGIEAGSPPALATDEDYAATSTALDGDITADTSTANADDDETSFFDAITEAAEGKSDKAEGEDPDDADTPAAAKADSDKKPADAANPEDGDADSEWEETVPFHKHPRWQQMVKQRNDFKDQLQEFQPKAEQFQQIESFMETQQLSNQEVAEGFKIMALMKNDPAKALETLRVHMQQLEGFTGEILPTDLQEEVDEGFITSDRAREIARLRNQGQFNANRAAEQETRRNNETQQRTVHDAQSRQRTAVDTWQQETISRDADFKQKQPFVFRELAFLAQQSPPRNENDAVALAQRAYDNVNTQMKNLVPRKPEIKPSVTSDRASANQGAAPQPDSFMEAVRQAADSAR